MHLGKLRSLSIAALLAAVIPAARSRASVVFTDGFGDGSRKNNGLDAGATATDPTDVGVPWFFAGSGTSAATFKVVDDSAGIGSGNALQLFNTSSNNRPVAAQFPSAVTLNDGDTISYKFDMRLVSTSVATVDRAFRFGLYNNAGTFITGDQGSADTSYNDDVGYNCRVDIGADTSNNTTMDVTRDDSTTATILAGTTTAIVQSNNTTGVQSTLTANQIVDANKHHFELDLTRSGGSLLISLQEDGNAALTGDDPTPTSTQNFTFNEAVFSTRSTSATDYRFDNVEVDYIAAVPEPASLGVLSAVASLGLARRKRR